MAGIKRAKLLGDLMIPSKLVLNEAEFYFLVFERARR
jgi:hypothetical protein